MAIKLSPKSDSQGLVKSEVKQESVWKKSFSDGFDAGASRRAKELRAKGYEIQWRKSNDS